MRRLLRSATYNRSSWLSRSTCGVLAFERLRFRRETPFRAHGRFAECAPHPFEFSAVGVKHDDAVIAIAVRDEQFVGLRIHLHVWWASEILRVVVALARIAVPDLHDKRAALSELQHLI